MLRQLRIRQFAIIDDLVLQIGTGMTVLSGETGAGKSILLDALGLLLGDRAESDSIRGDATRAEVDAEFDLADARPARDWLDERDLKDEDDADACLIRRVVSRDGRSRCYINGRQATARDLRELGGQLVDIHGQHAHQRLFQRRAQQDMLDRYGVAPELRARVAELARSWHSLRARIDQLRSGDRGTDRTDFLRYQIRELEALEFHSNELEELDTELRRLANVERLLQDGQQALTLLYEGDEGSVHELIGRATDLAQGIAAIDSGFAEAAELAESASIQVREAADALRHALDRLSPDPERLQTVEQRLADIHDMARKHRIAPDALDEHLEGLRTELAEIEGAADEVARIEAALATTEEDYRAAASELSKARQRTATELAGAVTETLKTLGMPEGRFEIQIDTPDSGDPRPQGIDQIEFRISANPGQPPRPLARVASGGELSRISLAIQVIAMEQTALPTMIFDEVDAGIGGGVAEIVGRLLRRLGGHAQVLCVTHLPQVAAQANHHLHVRKEIRDRQTFTHIEALDPEARVEEVARMLGGLKITAQTRAHAREMIASPEAAR